MGTLVPFVKESASFEVVLKVQRASRVLSLTLAESSARTIRISVARANSFAKSSLFAISFGTPYPTGMAFMKSEARSVGMTSRRHWLSTPPPVSF